MDWGLKKGLHRWLSLVTQISDDIVTFYVCAWKHSFKQSNIRNKHRNAIPTRTLRTQDDQKLTHELRNIRRRVLGL